MVGVDWWIGTGLVRARVCVLCCSLVGEAEIQAVWNAVGRLLTLCDKTGLLIIASIEFSSPLDLIS